MATHYKAFVKVGELEHELILWSDKDRIEKSDSQVMSDIMHSLQLMPSYLNKPISFDLKKVIECDSKGATIIHDEYSINDKAGMNYGFLQKGLGNSEWIYESPNLLHGEKVNTSFNGNDFELFGKLIYKSNWVVQNLPKNACIDWDRLEVHCEDQVLELEVVAR